jgi:transcriptional regulator GlxA family with amidase domain
LSSIYVSSSTILKNKNIFSTEKINDYVLALRIEAAKTLLAQTRLPIELIAMKTGFCSPSYFSQTFKRLTGKTPRAYRYSPT